MAGIARPVLYALDGIGSFCVAVGARHATSRSYVKYYYYYYYYYYYHLIG